MADIITYSRCETCKGTGTDLYHGGQEGIPCVICGGTGKIGQTYFNIDTELTTINDKLDSILSIIAK